MSFGFFGNEGQNAAFAFKLRSMRNCLAAQSPPSINRAIDMQRQLGIENITAKLKKGRARINRREATISYNSPTPAFRK